MSNTAQSPSILSDSAVPGLSRTGSDLPTECKRCDALPQELARTQAERDAYLKAIYKLLRDGYPAPNFNKEEILAHLDDQPSIHDLIAELEGAERPV